MEGAWASHKTSGEAAVTTDSKTTDTQRNNEDMRLMAEALASCAAHGDDAEQRIAAIEAAFERTAALLKLRLGLRLIVMTATCNLLDSAQRAVRNTMAPALAVSLAKVQDTEAPEEHYRPGITVMRVDDTNPNGSTAATLEARATIEGGQPRAVYVLHVAGAETPTVFKVADQALRAAIGWVQDGVRADRGGAGRERDD